MKRFLWLLALLVPATALADVREPEVIGIQRFRVRAVYFTVGETIYKAPIGPGRWYRVRRDLPFKVTLAVRASRVMNPCPPDNPCSIRASFVLRIPDGREAWNQAHLMENVTTEPGESYAYAVGPISVPVEIPPEYLGQALMTWTFSDKDGVFFSFAMNFAFRERNPGE